jgi:hypothetical protein
MPITFRPKIHFSGWSFGFNPRRKGKPVFIQPEVLYYGAGETGKIKMLKEEMVMMLYMPITI